MSRDRSVALFVVAGLALALTLAFFVSPRASTSPDGLINVATKTSIDRGATSSPSTHAPLSNYHVAGVDNRNLSKGLAGAVGVVITFGITLGVARWMARRRTRSSAPVPSETQTA